MNIPLTAVLFLVFFLLVAFLTSVIVRTMRTNRIERQLLEETEKTFLFRQRQKSLGKKEFTFHKGRVRIFARTYMEAHLKFQSNEEQGKYKDLLETGHYSA